MNTGTERQQILFDELGLGSVLVRYQMVVPRNQREYSWTRDEVSQLLQDFSRAINEGVYFLGSIVTIPRPDGTLEVVDGQQRLATTAILLAAIRDYLEDKDEQMIVADINTKILAAIDRNKREYVPRLTLNADDNELFRRITIKGEDTPEESPTRTSHQLLLQAQQLAAEHIRSLVATWDIKDHGDLLNRWVSFIENDAVVVLIRVPNPTDAFKMFETLNDRGLGISQVDLVKNYLFAQAGSRIDEVQSRWTSMRGTLESSDEDEIVINFLRHALIVVQGHVRVADIYDRVQTRVKSEQGAVAFAATLENLAAVYISTFNPAHERWSGYPESARKAIQVFDLLGIKPMRPTILAAAAKMSNSQVGDTFQFLISLGVRLLLASSTRSASVEIPLAEAAYEIFKDSIDSVEGLKHKLESISPSDADFQDAVARTRVTNSKLARYYLRSMEMQAKSQPAPWFMPTEDPLAINLEHVLPKNPEGKWPSFDDEEAANYVGRLGNLALMRTNENSEFKSSTFKRKKQIYKESPYLLTSQIADLNEWAPSAIVHRQEQMAELAVKTWPV